VAERLNNKNTPWACASRREHFRNLRRNFDCWIRASKFGIPGFLHLEFRISNFESSMKLSIIANPVAGGGRAYRSIRNYIRSWRPADWEAEILTTCQRGHAGLLARELLKNPPDLAAICGGDGTVNEVASLVPEPPFPIGLIPAGTANVIARELGLPLNPVKALQIALKRAVRRVDLGELGPGSRRRFVFVAGIGFDAYVASRVNPVLKAKLGMAAYAAAIVYCLRSYPFSEFQVTAAGRTFTATSCIASNAKSYGGGLVFTPTADMSDGLLDILILQGRRRLELAWFLIQAWLGKPAVRGWIHRLPAEELKMEGPVDVPVQADGELAGGLPLTIGLSRSIFPLVVPN
jgi:YegS/Rv2252/BmrU family lipid kinase